MSNENVVYKVKVNGQEYGADDKASAESLAELLGGEVFTTTRKAAMAHVRAITAAPDYPPVLANMVAEIKETMTSEIKATGLLDGSCYRVIAQYDSKHHNWYLEVKDLASGPEVYNQVTGEKYASICNARWEHGKSCAVKYLSNGINDDKFGRSKPEVILKEAAKAKLEAEAKAEAAAK